VSAQSDDARVTAELRGVLDAARALAHAESFAIASRAWASPTGTAEHPQAREVLRIIVGHASGLGGALFAGIERGGRRVRLSPIWQTNADAEGEPAG